jgi:hypothetical protein
VSEQHLTPRDAINFAIALSDGRPTAVFIERAIGLAGYMIVPAPGGAASTAESDAGTGAESAAPRSPPPRVPQPKPDVWPKICNRCHKVINDKAAADACEQSACPI